MEDRHTVREGDGQSREWSRLGAVAVLVGFLWSLVQALLTAVIVDTDTTHGQFCSDGESESLLISLSVLALASALTGSVFRLRRTVRPRAAVAAIAVEAVVFGAWVAAGGFNAFSCALDV